MESRILNRMLHCIVFAIFAICVNSKICFAGNINGDEARVLSVAKGTFEYNGEMYAAKQEFVDQLVAKLNSDDVDLTAEQADKAIANIYANVETGVLDGYIVKVKSGDDAPAKDDNNETAKPDGDDAGDEEKEETPPEKLTVKENDNGTITIENSSGDVEMAFDGVLKNTGFSIQNTITLLIIIGVVLLCVVVYSVKDILVTRNR